MGGDWRIRDGWLGRERGRRKKRLMEMREGKKNGWKDEGKRKRMKERRREGAYRIYLRNIEHLKEGKAITLNILRY